MSSELEPKNSQILSKVEKERIEIIRSVLPLVYSSTEIAKLLYIFYIYLPMMGILYGKKGPSEFVEEIASRGFDHMSDFLDRAIDVGSLGLLLQIRDPETRNEIKQESLTKARIYWLRIAMDENSEPHIRNLAYSRLESISERLPASENTTDIHLR